ncbi:enoyl-CoA hydratase-related protein [Tropicimonas sp. TH_r6]|uniref:enoyl-CoA hydratase-related protein n=1 Tax=Tropicimonas sp. TH_r6 TaxID=3082085 RepID=UPI0029559456|nr:enoyl-CoA hydratase-related protein [Tropicimonas sp. TH_r6]MDV7143511.1 enoyl-CoA hydratase-related protein [Tropicimonas sp. TH_r6]
MLSGIRLETLGTVAVAVLETGPGHALGLSARRALIRLAGGEGLEAEIGALVLFFASTVSVTPEHAAHPAADDGLAAACKALEDMEIPVVLGVAGDLSGPGAELALAAHFRLAEEGAVLAWPEVPLERLAGGGGTQRLARVVGAERTLDWLGTGRSVTAAEAVEAGLLDGVVSGELVDATVSLAQRLAEAGAGPRRSSKRTEGLANPAAFRAACRAFRDGGLGPKAGARAQLADCVEAALIMPFEAGVGFEMAAAAALLQSPAAQALEHLRRAEKAAVLPRGDAPPKSVALHQVMIEDAALGFLVAGCSVTLSEEDPARLRACLSEIGLQLASLVAKGEISPEARNDCLSRLSSASGPAELCGCELVLFGADVRPSARDLSRLKRVGLLAPGLGMTGRSAEAQLGPGAVGLFASAPCAAGGIVEIQPPAQGKTQDLAGLSDLLTQMGSLPVPATPGAGGPLIGRLSVRFLETGERLLEAGATPRQVDSALEAAGHETGLFRRVDAIGLRHVLAQRQAEAEHRDPRQRYVTVLDRLCAAGRLGRSAGRGFHDYPEGIPEGVTSAGVEALIDAARADAGLTARSVSAEEIVRLCHLSMVLEGLRMLAEGRVEMAGTFDLLATIGLGYPRRLGGPLFEAGREGWGSVKAALLALAEQEDARFWALPETYDRVVADMLS